MAKVMLAALVIATSLVGFIACAVLLADAELGQISGFFKKMWQPIANSFNSWIGH